MVLFKIQLSVKIAPECKGKYKLHTGYRFVSTMGLFIQMNIRLLIFSKFVEFLKSSLVKADLKVYSSLKIYLS